MPFEPSFLRMAVALGLLSAIGPFAIDMDLPVLPVGYGSSAWWRGPPR